jgi:plasmid stabilization system protein ParE
MISSLRLNESSKIILPSHKKLAQVIYDGIGALTKFPNRGRAGRVPGTRELIFAGLPFIAIYRLKDDTIEIVRLIHGAQQWPPSQK